MSEPLLRVAGLAKGYSWGRGRLEVLRGLDLAVCPGEMVAILGTSGVGKSTLLHLLGALDRPDSGSYHFRGADLFAGGDAGLARFRNREVGFVFQFHHLLPEFSAIENAMMPGLLGGLPTGEARERAVSLLHGLGLGERMDHRPGELSGGEQQRVAIARALLMEPSVLLADEPTGNLDPGTGGAVFDLLEGLVAQRGLAVVMATHNHELAARMNTLYRMEQGILLESNA